MILRLSTSLPHNDKVEPVMSGLAQVGNLFDIDHVGDLEKKVYR